MNLFIKREKQKFNKKMISKKYFKMDKLIYIYSNYPTISTTKTSRNIGIYREIISMKYLREKKRIVKMIYNS